MEFLVLFVIFFLGSFALVLLLPSGGPVTRQTEAIRQKEQSALGGSQFNFPLLSGRVVDQANVIPWPSRATVETKLKDLEDKSGIQLVVATVSSLQGSDIESFANRLFRAWRLGEAKKNDGVLFLIAPAERKMRIEVGYGVEGTLTDALSEVIISGTVRPRFKAGDFGGGVERGVDAIVEVLNGGASEWRKPVKAHDEGFDRPRDPSLGSLWPLLFPLGFVVLWVVFSWMWRHRDRGGGFSDYSSSGGSSGGGSSGGGGGDGFSGGGGSSGGGGASGGW